jgi:hypothetical protein
MAIRLGGLRIPWLRARQESDPYWEFFLNEPARDPKNLIVNRIRGAREGAVYPVKTDPHTPQVMSGHVKDLAHFFRADAVAILSGDLAVAAAGGICDTEGCPFAIVTLFQADDDARDAPGIGGHSAALKGAFATFHLGAIIREWGYRATRSPLPAEPVAAAAGLGVLGADGRLTTRALGRRVHAAEVILTDLPLEPDMRAP